MKKQEVKDNFNAVVLMREFLEFIGVPQDAYYLIKETGTYSVFYEMTKTLRTTFGKSEDSEVNKNETKLTFFVWVLSRIGQGAGGTMAYEGRDYKKNIIKKKENNEFNSEVEDIVEDIQDDLLEHKIMGAASLSKAITDSKDSFEELTIYMMNTLIMLRRMKILILLSKIFQKLPRILKRLNHKVDCVEQCDLSN